MTSEHSSEQSSAPGDIFTYGAQVCAFSTRDGEKGALEILKAKNSLRAGAKHPNKQLVLIES